MYFNILDIAFEKVMEKKVQELTHSSTNSMCPPPMKYKPNNGNKKSKKFPEMDVPCDPS